MQQGEAQSANDVNLTEKLEKGKTFNTLPEDLEADLFQNCKPPPKPPPVEAKVEKTAQTD